MVIIEITPRTEVNPLMSGTLLNLIWNSTSNGQPFRALFQKIEGQFVNYKQRL